MTLKVKNNASSTVADDPLHSGVSIVTVANGEGADFPSVGKFRLTIWDEYNYPDPTNDPGMEIVECTIRTDDELTIIRACEGTLDVEHDLGEKIAMLVTAGLFDDPDEGIYNMNIDGGSF